MKKDDQLLYEISEKEESSFVEFYNRYGEQLYLIVKQRLRKIHLAEDFLQDFWSKLWEKPEVIKTNEAGSAKGFLYCFISLRIIDYYRANNLNKLFFIDSFDINTLDMALQYSHVIEDVTVNEIIDSTEDILSALPEKEKQIYLLYQANYSVKEIAVKLSLNERTIQNKLTAISKYVRIKLGKLFTANNMPYVILIAFSLYGL